jgi:hypothetical protein
LKPSTELKLRCTEFDENGNVVLVNGEFKKQELIAKYSLMPRDLRKIAYTGQAERHHDKFAAHQMSDQAQPRVGV